MNVFNEEFNKPINNILITNYLPHKNINNINISFYALNALLSFYNLLKQ